VLRSLVLLLATVLGGGMYCIRSPLVRIMLSNYAKLLPFSC
jgi:hypothetical protein